MIISDIVIQNKHNYDICLEDPSNYNIMISPKIQSYECTVNGLLSVEDIYGDELKPLIMYLKTNSDIVPFVVLIDDKITEYPSQINIESYLNKIENATVIFVNHNEFQIISSLDRLNSQIYVQSILNKIHANIIAEIYAITYITISDKYIFSFQNIISKSMLLTLYIESTDKLLMNFDDMYLIDLDNMTLNDMDIIDSNMKILQSKLNTLFKIDMSDINNFIPLMCNIYKISNTNYVKINGNYNYSICPTIDFEYEVYFNNMVNYINFGTLITNLNTEFLLYPQNSIKHIVSDINMLDLSLYITGKNIRFSCEVIVDDVDITPTINYYRDYLLTDMDNYTIMQLDNKRF